MPAIAESVPTKVVQRVRIESIDVVRGVIMILMALDHTRDFFGNSGLNPTDPATTTVSLFFTRWITHFCAPVFFLLTGTGAYLSLRKKSKSELSRFLFTRGLWLIFLELAISRCLGWQFNFDYHVVFIIVLWALGWAMIVLSALVYLPACTVDRRDRSGLRTRPDLQLARGAAQGILAAAGAGAEYGICHLARDQRLWRSTALVSAEILGIYGALIYEHDEVSAVVAVPVDDAWSGDAFPVGDRHRNPALAAARAHHRQSADVLLPAARAAYPSDCHCSVLRALRAGALDVRVSDHGPVPRHTTAGLGIFAADCVPGVGNCSGDTVSAVPMVCWIEAAAQ